NHRNLTPQPPLLLRSGVSLIGAGRGASVVRLGESALEPAQPEAAVAVIANFTNPMFNPAVVPDAPPPRDQAIRIAHLTVDGNRAGNPGEKGHDTACISLDNVSRPRITDVALVAGGQVGL